MSAGKGTELNKKLKTGNEVNIQKMHSKKSYGPKGGRDTKQLF
jgi:hypothetical protein